MPEVSIIVPVYNVEKYLPKCLDSLLGQTFNDIEIICVDDGSTDGSGEILGVYAQRDSRIKIVTKENGGLFSARHEGMKYINGKYVIFVDSDDWVSESLVEKCLEAASDENTDVVVFGAFSVREKTAKQFVNAEAMITPKFLKNLIVRIYSNILLQPGVKCIVQNL